MNARVAPDGTAHVECSPQELRAILHALETVCGLSASRSAALAREARDRRELADKVRRGRLANRRVAGELDSQAAAYGDQSLLLSDLVRIIWPLVSEAERRANLSLSQQATSQE